MKPGSEIPARQALCLFFSDGRPLAIALEVVAEIVASGGLVRLPLCPRQVLGLWTYRGRVVPIVGPGPPGKEQGLAAPAPEKGQAYAILRTSQGLWGLRIGRGGVRIEVDPAVRSAEGVELPGGFVAAGAVESQGTSYAILDHERTWRALKSEIDCWYGHSVERRHPDSPSASPSGRDKTRSGSQKGGVLT